MSDRVRAYSAGLSLLTIGLLLATGHAAAQEQAWVRGEVRLNLRTGPGTQFRIVGATKTGDGATVLERTDEWTKIRLEDGKEGWIPIGFLKAEPPPTLRLEQLEGLSQSLEKQLGTVQQEVEALRQKNDLLVAQDGDQQAKIKTLTMENMELRAGARWPEWITGASIFAAGMLLGAMWHRGSTRRQTTRIRL